MRNIGHTPNLTLDPQHSPDYITIGESPHMDTYSIFGHIFCFWRSLRRSVWLQSGNLSLNTKLNKKRNKHHEKRESITPSIWRNMNMLKYLKCLFNVINSNLGSQISSLSNSTWSAMRHNRTSKLAYPTVSKQVSHQVGVEPTCQPSQLSGVTWDN